MSSGQPYRVRARVAQDEEPEATHARGLVPGLVGGEQPGGRPSPSSPANHPLLRPFTPYSPEEGFSAGQAQRNRGRPGSGKRNLVDTTGREDLAGAKDRLSSRSIVDRDEEISAYEPSIGELVYNEGVKQVVGGAAEGMFHGTMSTIRDLADWVESATGIKAGGFVIESDPDSPPGKWKPSIRWSPSEDYYGEEGPPTLADALIPKADEADTVAGGMIRGISQFLGMFIGLGKAGLTGTALKGATTTIPSKVPLLGGKTVKSGRFADAALRGAVADFVAFDADDPFVGDAVKTLVDTYPNLKGPVTDLIEEYSFSTDPDDSRIKKRFMRSVEGLGLGTAAEGLFLGLKALYGSSRGALRAHNAKKLMDREGIDPDAPAEAGDVARHEELDNLEAERAADDVDPGVEGATDLDARLLEAAGQDPRAARREGRSRTIQSIMDKFGISQVEAEEWYSAKLQERVLPKLLAREADATAADLSSEIDQWEKELGRTLEEIRSGATPELRRMRMNPILSTMRDQGGVATVRQNAEGEWVRSNLAGELANMGVTPKSHPGLFRDPRKRSMWSKFKRSETDAPKGDLDGFDWTDNPLIGGAKDDYGRPENFDDIYDGIREELSGNPRRTPEEIDTILERGIARDELRAELDELGIDLENVSNREAVEAIHRKHAEAMGPEYPRVEEPRAADASYASSQAVGSSLETTIPEITVTKTGPDEWVDDAGVQYSDANVDALVPPRTADAAEEAGAPTVAVDFAGGGTMEANLGRHATTHAAEIDPKISAEYNKSHGTNFDPQNVHDVDPAQIADADLYHASPVCKSLSPANIGRKVQQRDIDSAEKIASNIIQARPKTVTVENVPEFTTKPELMDPITDALDEAGYTWDVQIHDAAEYGGVQTRKRMIIRAVREGELPPIPRKSDPGDWHKAIEDLIDDAPDAPFGASRGKRKAEGKGNWEEERIAEMVERGELDPTKPIITMGGSASSKVAYARNAGEPAPTLKATDKENPRIVLPDGRVKELTPRMMARLQGLPDSFRIPENKKLAKTIIGNGIHGETTRNFIDPLLRRASGGAGTPPRPRPGPHPERPELTKSPGRLEDRPAWELSWAEEAELHGVPEGTLRALERIPRAGGPTARTRKSGVEVDPARESKKARPEAREQEQPAMFPELAAGSPRATAEQVQQLRTAGFIDEAGELTPKGAETMAGRIERFKKFQESARRGEKVNRMAAVEYPLQIGRAYRYKKTMTPGGRPKGPGQDAADDLTVDEAKAVSEDILSQRRVWDERRGRELQEKIDELTEKRFSADANKSINNAVLDLFEAGDVTRDPNRKLFEQIAELIASRRVAPEEMARILSKHNMDWTDLGAAWAVDKSDAGRTLGALGNLERAIRRGMLSKKQRLQLEDQLRDDTLSVKEREDIEKVLGSGVLGDEEIELLRRFGIDQDIVKAMGTWRRLENIRRGMLVSQIATAMRNQMTQFGNVSTAVLVESMERAIKAQFKMRGMTERADAIHPIRGFETLVNVFREGGARLSSRASEGTESVDNILRVFAKERDLLTSSFNADIASGGYGGAVLGKLEKASHWLNTMNRFQEHVFRRAAFKAELGRQVEMNPIRMDDGSIYRSIDALEKDSLIGAIPQNMIRKSVDRALEITWAKDFDPYKADVVGGVKQRHAKFERRFGKFIQFVNDTPVLSWVVPFPRFMANSLQWQLDHSLYGLTNAVVSKRGRELMKQGDYSEFAEGMVGTTMFFGAYQLADSQYATDIWYEYRVPDAAAGMMGLEPGSTLDIRPYAPFSAYLFGAHVMKHGIVPLLEGRPTNIHSMSYTDMAQGLIASNVRAGLGLYVVDQLLRDLMAVGSGEGSRGAKTGQITGQMIGNVAASYLVPLNMLYDAYKGFQQFQGDMESSKVRDAKGFFNESGMPLGTGPEGKGVPTRWEGTGSELFSSFEGGAKTFGSAFLGQMESRIPMLASRQVGEYTDRSGETRPIRRYPEVELPTRSGAPVSYAPFWKLLTGMTFKDPKNTFENELAKHDFSRSDILPSGPFPQWNRSVAKHMGDVVEEHKIPEQLRMPMYRDLKKAGQVEFLRDLIQKARDEARIRAHNDNPRFGDYVKEHSRDYRRSLFEREGWSREERVPEQ